MSKPVKVPAVVFVTDRIKDKPNDAATLRKSIERARKSGLSEFQMLANELRASMPAKRGGK
jgi:hypothetical protein